MAEKKKTKNTETEPEKTGTPQQQALSAAMDKLTGRFGKGTLMRLGSSDHLNVQVIPTGSLPLDIALGVGGLPRGRVVEIFGPEASGKTTLCYHAIANAQKEGGECVFIDTEHALDPVYAGNIGVDIENLIVSQPETGEQALDIAEEIINSGGAAVVVIDSVAALVPEAELKGEMGDASMALQARMMSKALRKLSGALRKTNTLLIFTNQMREKIGVMFGPKTTTPGGKALQYYASVRLDIRRIETLKKGDNPIGNKVRVKVVKNKVAPPFKQAEFDVMYGEGVSRTGCVLDLAVDDEIVKKSGAFYSYGDDRLAQGRDNAKNYLAENPELLDEIETKVRAIEMPEPVVEPEPESDLEAKDVDEAEEVVDSGSESKESVE